MKKLIIIAILFLLYPPISQAMLTPFSGPETRDKSKKNKQDQNYESLLAEAILNRDGRSSVAKFELMESALDGAAKAAKIMDAEGRILEARYCPKCWFNQITIRFKAVADGLYADYLNDALDIAKGEEKTWISSEGGGRWRYAWNEIREVQESFNKLKEYLEKFEERGKIDQQFYQFLANLKRQEGDYKQALSRFEVVLKEVDREMYDLL